MCLLEHSVSEMMQLSQKSQNWNVIFRFNVQMKAKQVELSIKHDADQLTCQTSVALDVIPGFFVHIERGKRNIVSVSDSGTSVRMIQWIRLWGAAATYRHRSERRPQRPGESPGWRGSLSRTWPLTLPPAAPVPESLLRKQQRCSLRQSTSVGRGAVSLFVTLPLRTRVAASAACCFNSLTSNVPWLFKFLFLKTDENFPSHQKTNLST